MTLPATDPLPTNPSPTNPSPANPSPTDPRHDDSSADAALQADIAAERTHLAESRDALRRMRERAQHLFRTGEQVAGDAYSAETLGRTLSRRIAELTDDPSTPLFFGKLSFGGSAPEHHSGRRYHVGRRHVTDDAGEPMVLDWRAPLSRTFYQASARDPQGVAVRRRFGFHAGALTSFEDEHLDRGEELGTASKILTAEIERPRVGPMRDIVATIQPDQDELVRADFDETICVQGAPGTGKTAVGLHRAAYLLYLHRDRLRRSGVLVVGPNRAFLHYISAVLPALGEVEVEQACVEDLLTRVQVRFEDPANVVALKQDERMAAVLANALVATYASPSRGWSCPTAPGGGACRPRRCAASSTTYGGRGLRTRWGATGYGRARSACSSARPRPVAASLLRTPGCDAWGATRRSGSSSTTRGPR